MLPSPIHPPLPPASRHAPPHRAKREQGTSQPDRQTDGRTDFIHQVEKAKRARSTCFDRQLESLSIKGELGPNLREESQGNTTHPLLPNSTPFPSPLDRLSLPWLLSSKLDICPTLCVNCLFSDNSSAPPSRRRLAATCTPRPRTQHTHTCLWAQQSLLWFLFVRRPTRQAARLPINSTSLQSLGQDKMGSTQFGNFGVST